MADNSRNNQFRKIIDELASGTAYVTYEDVLRRLGSSDSYPKITIDPKYDSLKTFINRELRGLIIGLALGILYLLVIVYAIIPGLPLSGTLLDRHADLYIDKLFGANSLFNQGFIFIVTVLFALVGFGYGFMAKTTKTSKDVTESLAYSLDGIGSILVLLFFASLFTSVFKESGIGEVVTALLTEFMGGLKFTGIGLILIVIALIAIANLFCPDSITKWSILSATLVPLFMNASISPEFTQIIYTAGNSITNGITPLFTYFVIYLAFLEKYNNKEIISTMSGIRYMSLYSLYTAVIMIAVIVGWYMIGIPIGIGAFPGVMYGA